MLIFLILVFLLLVIFSWPLRWIILNGSAASIYAKKILLGEEVSNEQFIDYIIYTTTSGCVVFGRHEQDEKNSAMVYCPNGIPLDRHNIGDLSHVFGVWYKTN